MEPVREDPMWSRIADELRTDIADELYAPGAPLPGEVALAARYQASRPTVRRAIAELVGEGLISASHGRGTYVRPRPDRRAILLSDSDHPDLLAAGYDPARQGWLRGEHPEAARLRAAGNTAVTDTVLTRADRDQAEALGISTGQWIIHRFQHWRHRASHRDITITSITPAHLIGFTWGQAADEPPADLNPFDPTTWPTTTSSDDEPADLDHDHHDQDDEPDTDHADSNLDDLYARLADRRGPVRFTTQATARMPYGDERADLRIDTGTPILEIRRTMLDPDGRALEVTTIDAPADRFTVTSATHWQQTPTGPVAVLTL